MKSLSKLKKTRILNNYAELVMESEYSEPLCIFLSDYDIKIEFVRYLKKERILKDGGMSILGEYFIDDAISANLFRIWVLEDFLNTI